MSRSNSVVVPFSSNAGLRRSIGALIAIATLSVNDVATAENRYGAIAYSQSTRRYAWANGHESREAAEAAALKQSGDHDAFIAVYGSNSWLALAHGNGTSYGWARDPNSEQAAKDAAVANCASRASSCHLMISIYAGGTGRAKVIAKVPNGATVSGKNFEVPIKSGIGSFDSKELLGGKEHFTTLTARMVVDGRVVEQTVRNSVYAFHTTVFTFSELEAVAELGNPPAMAGEVPVLPLLKP